MKRAQGAWGSPTSSPTRKPSSRVHDTTTGCWPHDCNGTERSPPTRIEYHSLRCKHVPNKTRYLIEPHYAALSSFGASTIWWAGRVQAPASHASADPISNFLLTFFFMFNFYSRSRGTAVTGTSLGREKHGKQAVSCLGFMWGLRTLSEKMRREIP